MAAENPIFVDITWGTAGSTRSVSLDLAEYCQKFIGVDVLLHLSCTNMTKAQIASILLEIKAAGIKNILALRGDRASSGSTSKSPMKAGLPPAPPGELCDTALDLVKLIRSLHGDYFGIAVAAYPEGHIEYREKYTLQQEILYLKEKIDAGADFVMTQYFYDAQNFLHFINECKEAGITCPIIPGMMPIQSFSVFQRLVGPSQLHIPEHIWTDLALIRDDEEEVKNYGVKLCVDMCNTLHREGGVCGFHFYTLNLEKSVLSAVKELEMMVLSIDEIPCKRRTLPWRGSRSDLNGHVEDVRPINWCNRPNAYIQRTVTWDEFPNGRWGDNRSPAFGDVTNMQLLRPTFAGTKDTYLTLWGDAPIEPAEVYDVFAKYVEGKIPILPWCELALQEETSQISSDLLAINRAGFMTINSQPAVNGCRSDDSVYGWGGAGGYVYQKAYVEFFVSPTLLALLMDTVNKSYPGLNLHAVNFDKKHISNGHKGVTALTWGVFPNKEVLQPTVFDPVSFLVWSEEAFGLWESAWVSLYDTETASGVLLADMHDTYFLAALMDNDYVSTDGIFKCFHEVIDLLNDGGPIHQVSSLSTFSSLTPPPLFPINEHQEDVIEMSTPCTKSSNPNFKSMGKLPRVPSDDMAKTEEDF